MSYCFALGLHHTFLPSPSNESHKSFSTNLSFFLQKVGACNALMQLLKAESESAAAAASSSHAFPYHLLERLLDVMLEGDEDRVRNSVHDQILSLCECLSFNEPWLELIIQTACTFVMLTSYFLFCPYRRICWRRTTRPSCSTTRSACTRCERLRSKRMGYTHPLLSSSCNLFIIVHSILTKHILSHQSLSIGSARGRARKEAERSRPS